jgi:putative CocE/NonD family hydrolase
MNPFARLAGRAVDRALGLPGTGVPVVTRRDVGVPMPDGVVLLGDHHRPAQESGPLPVVLVRSPYGRAGLAAVVFGAPIARQGFQVFIQSTRGTFGSGGQFRPFLHEQADGLATVAWLREQPWCDGRVATVGASYLGHTQWAIAAYVDPPLESVSLNITAARITSAFYDHGAPGLRNALNWTGQIGRQERGVLPPVVPNPVHLAAMRKALRKTPLQAADVAVAGAPVPFWRDFVDHADPADDFWAPADHHHVDMSRMPPVSMVTGWWDLFAAEQLRDFAAIRAAGVQAQIIVGPWLHGEPAELRAITRQDVAWLRHHLLGDPGPRSLPVRVYLQQAHKWLDLTDWPPPVTTATYYLRQHGTLAREPEPGDAAPAAFVFDPADPTPTAGGPVLQPPGKQVDNASIEARADVLTYTSEPLAVDQDIVGSVKARVYVRTSRQHADVFLRVCDVDEKGVSRNVVDGIRRLSPQTVPAADVEVGADGLLTVDVELFPTAYRMLAGHRIRLQVSGGAFPRYARNHGTGEPFGAATAMHECSFEVVADAEHQARIALPIVSSTP